MNPALTSPLLPASACPCPNIFNVQGGTRVLLVRAGPGLRAQKERTAGKCDRSTSAYDDQVIVGLGLTENIQIDVASNIIEPIVSTISRFDGATTDTRPHVFHDGAAKSRDSFAIFKRFTRMSFVDAMARKDSDEPDFWWNTGLNTCNVQTQKTIIVFCGMQTIYRVLAQAGIKGRFACASGGVIPVTFPLFGQPSLCLGQGAQARDNMRWGTVTDEEFRAGAAAVSTMAPCAVVVKRDVAAEKRDAAASALWDAGVGWGTVTTEMQRSEAVVSKMTPPNPDGPPAFTSDAAVSKMLQFV